MKNKIKHFRNSREDMKVTQQDIANYIGGTKSRISNYEMGKRKVTLDDARGIVGCLKSFGIECCLDTVFPNSKFKEEVQQ
ncbi:XRE family transcriptional regulator [Alteromonadaceae bacterium M269]|nr:XRE family transcriptional regulator [Alteromonadaceae bacterium M269]